MFITVLVCGAVFGIAWFFIRRQFLLPASRLIKSLHSQTLAPHANADDRPMIDQWIHAVQLGFELGRHTRRTAAFRHLNAAPAYVRPYMVTGAVLADGAIRSFSARTIRSMLGAWTNAQVQNQSAACFGIGWMYAIRNKKDVETLLRMLQLLDPWQRCLCIDGYGFANGLLYFSGEPRVLAHLHALPGNLLRSAYQGVGRAMYFTHLSDRRGFIESAARFAPDHDLDVLEGAGYSAAYHSIDHPGEALRFARAMPYEWRDAVHLGITLGFYARSVEAREYFQVCVSALPDSCKAAVSRAVVTADELIHAICKQHPGVGYSLWRDRLANRLHREGLWEPIYSEAPEQTPSGGEGAMR